MTPPFLSRSFFGQTPLICAREMIGATLVWKECAGIIVETEAYSTEGDEACHTFFRPAARAFVESHPEGTAYVYLNYGVHWLLNVVIKNRTEHGFVLIRALQPTAGLAAMELRRRKTEGRALCSGPGKLTQALGVTGVEHGRDLCAGGKIGFLPRGEAVQVETDVRIGISKAAHLPWRFLWPQSQFVSVVPKRTTPSIKGDPPKKKPTRRTGLASGK